MIKLIKNEEGVSSVLIVIMMIVLIILGVSGLTLAMSNGRLADKKIEWLSDYYALEGDANTKIALVYEAVLSATTDDELYHIINALNADKTPEYTIKRIDNTTHNIEFTVQKDAEYPKYINVVLSAKKDADNTYSLTIKRFMQDQAPFEYGSLFDFK